MAHELSFLETISTTPIYSSQLYHWPGFCWSRRLSHYVHAKSLYVNHQYSFTPSFPFLYWRKKAIKEWIKLSGNTHTEPNHLCNPIHTFHATGHNKNKWFFDSEVLTHQVHVAANVVKIRSDRPWSRVSTGPDRRPEPLVCKTVKKPNWTGKTGAGYCRPDGSISVWNI
jgi:hypothetical protein